MTRPGPTTPHGPVHRVEACLVLPLGHRDHVRQRGKTVEIIGLNDPSADLHGKLTGELTSR
uniref:Uncharacterized protein n=1 Tax=Streptomyces sp. NBC_00003 TaxID=2903608 RepID=A0AAU2UZM8_9ACTN